MAAGDGGEPVLRLLRRIGAGQRVAAPAPAGAGASADGSLAAEALARGLCAVAQGRLVLSAAGKAMLRRALAGGDGLGAQHQDRRQVQTAEGPVVVNDRESPLAWLRRRRAADGKPLIDPAQFAAGERLRSDFTRGQLGPRVTSNWNAAVASGRRSAAAGGMAEITDAALAARIRVEKALAAVGPELAGMLLDFCCFLKGIEEIERERRWPARSAKLVLGLALSALARHYGIETEARGPEASRGMRHWGAEDYRPDIG